MTFTLLHFLQRMISPARPLGFSLLYVTKNIPFRSVNHWVSSFFIVRYIDRVGASVSLFSYPWSPNF